MDMIYDILTKKLTILIMNQNQGFNPSFEADKEINNKLNNETNKKMSMVK